MPKLASLDVGRETMMDPPVGGVSSRIASMSAGLLVGASGGWVFGKCSHLPTALGIGAAVSLIPVISVQFRKAKFVAALVVVALVAAACGTETTSTSAVESGPAAAVVDDVAITVAPPQSSGAEANNGVAVDNYPTFVGSTSLGESFDMASLAGEDVILWFWAPW